MSLLPPTGWYPDPEHNGVLRYWDGTAWTDHRTPDDLPAAPRRIGDWLSITFATAWRQALPLLAISVVCLVVPAIPLALAMNSLLRDVVVRDGDVVTGVAEGAIVPAIVTGLAAIAGAVVFAVAAGHQAVYAQRGHRPTAAASLGVGVRALVRAFALTLAIGAGLATVLVAVLFLPGAGLAALGVFAWATLVVFVATRVAFIYIAAAAAPPGIGPLRASAEVGIGRTGAVLGRLLLLALVCGGVTLVASFILSPITAVAGNIDPDAIEFADDGTIDNAVMADFLPDTAGVVVQMAVSALVEAIGFAVGLVGLAVIYLDVRAPMRPEP
ncbi:MAG: DUF2510 domain-containing protein [Acidimicrobiales bacterium]|nr:DUF2510 domain-containing protein [Acidimicrobiales bacterium]